MPQHIVWERLGLHNGQPADVQVSLPCVMTSEKVHQYGIR
jgi:hypothetical protein